MNSSHNRKIAVIGLGYVGLPLAIALASKTKVIGFDIDLRRVAHLKQNHDCTHEVSEEVLNQSTIEWTSDKEALAQADFYIIAVPTPVDEAQQPDLTYLWEATKIVASLLKKGDIVVYESTVYPGTTQEECVPLLEAGSDLICGQDFSVGYSPERTNAGDKLHQLSNVIKIISGWDEPTTEIIEQVYQSVVKKGVYRAPSIKIAEAAKIIENTQRDVNIALINEFATIFEKMNIDTQQVLKAASTKWNFMPFQPGLVGGHCISVDPYYISYKAKLLGCNPELILSARKINDRMGQYIAQQTIKKMIQSGVLIKGSKVAILGLSFKENCCDLRNSKVLDLMKELLSYGIELIIHDPLADKAQVQAVYAYPMSDWSAVNAVDAIILCIAHQSYKDISLRSYIEKLSAKGARVIFDVKSILHAQNEEEKAALQTIHLCRL